MIVKNKGGLLMGMTFKKKDSLEKLFEEFAIDPDKKENEKAINKSTQFKVDITNATVTFKDNKKSDSK
ncbi:SPJ_0845 family protein [Vagococcus fluvialis]|uniref:SPJ_0845 family protein n=2 Tax=Vagococcus fluvialis TaxID=2738 RepID=UPI001D0A0B0C|nr:SPJ_0845 family protein [Vagococcus fluvialis]UDM70558.1 hypothetical protein K5L00_10535 [Vagococcus fluvialis]UDM82245.1 hypothetical protein K5K96_13015 [Vagococcus fluvialis]